MGLPHICRHGGTRLLDLSVRQGKCQIYFLETSPELGSHATWRILKNMKWGTQIGCGCVWMFSCMTQAYHATSHCIMNLWLMFGQWKEGEGSALASTPLPTDSVIMSICSQIYHVLHHERTKPVVDLNGTRHLSISEWYLSTSGRNSLFPTKLWSVSLSEAGASYFPKHQNAEN